MTTREMRTLNLIETAEFLKINGKTAQEMAAKGDLPGCKIGRSWVFLEDDLVTYLREQVDIQRQERLERFSESANDSTEIESPPPKPETSRQRRGRRKTPPQLPVIP